MQSSVIHDDRINLTLSPFFWFGRAPFGVLWLSASPSTQPEMSRRPTIPPDPAPHISTLSLQPPAWASVGVQASSPFLRWIFCVTAWLFQSRKKQEVFHINHLPVYLEFEACIFLCSPVQPDEAVSTMELCNQLYLILVPAVMRNYPLCLNFYF